MALKYYKNKHTEEVKRSLKDLGEDWEEILVAPNQKFMVCSDKDKNVSKLKDNKAILTARSRNHARDVDLDNNIQVNLANGLKEQVQTAFLNSKGQRRRKIDDI